MRYLDTETAKQVSKIGLGTVQFGSPEWGYGDHYDQREAPAIVRRALELGITLFDTAEIYSSGRSERILGQALGDKRPSVFIATKMFPILPGAAIVKRRAAASALRLGVSRLDLYQVHYPNPLAGDGAIMRGMRSLKRAGLISEVGVSAYSLERWRAAERSLRSRILSNQVRYSLLDRSAETDLLPFAASHGRVIIAFSPLEQGLLSGKYHASSSQPMDRARAGNLLFSAANLERSSGLIGVMREIAAAHCATPAQIALAYVIRHPAVAAIPAAATVGQLESNVAAAEIELAEDEYQALHDASARAYPATTADPFFERKLSALRHVARCSRYVADTMRLDYELKHAPVSQPRA
jgi:aryl-alcohol dehydrogenase-like predicted oxidoreductase